jgi:hypothetical protein
MAPDMEYAIEEMDEVRSNEVEAKEADLKELIAIETHANYGQADVDRFQILICNATNLKTYT